MNPDQPQKTRNTVDNSQPSKEAARNLSEDEKKQLEMQSEMEHEQGPAREKLAVQATDIDQKK